jgi:tagatose-6-phosphate ketose/aldose isomerase
LKVQELSDGKVICTYDSFLGFRHGPRAVVDDTTLITYLLSNNAYAQRYEVDLIKSINESPTGAKSVGVGYGFDTHGLKMDFAIEFPECAVDIPEEFYTVLYIVPAQIIGFYKSLDLGLEPDSPSKGGAISRVVQGVKIY